ncbi:hypothetical protein [Paenibacillus sp. NPDC058174]|uniref:hypothetical protein n=1 Tax=Paenibacillus sp. NPDC058174 TaxID=3346366 RepID=UPI0036D7FF45
MNKPNDKKSSRLYVNQPNGKIGKAVWRTYQTARSARLYVNEPNGKIGKAVCERTKR